MPRNIRQLNCTMMKWNKCIKKATAVGKSEKKFGFTKKQVKEGLRKPTNFETTREASKSCTENYNSPSKRSEATTYGE